MPSVPGKPPSRARRGETAIKAGVRAKPRSGRPAKAAPRTDTHLPGEGWIWGRHAAQAAIENPRRRVHAIFATQNMASQLGLPETRSGVALATPKEIDALLPPGAVHQGVALRADAAPETPLKALGKTPSGVLLMLDQVTDPHNVGAVIRSAAAFGAQGLILQDRKAPPFFGACAKAAVGAVEWLAHARVVNLSRALETLREAGWVSIGLAGAGPETVADAVAEARDATGGVVLVLGSEDKGLRPSVAKACDRLARIPIDASVESLNISTAAAVALYAARAAFLATD